MSRFTLATFGWVCIAIAALFVVAAAVDQSFALFGAAVFPLIIGCVFLSVDDMRKGMRP